METSQEYQEALILNNLPLVTHMIKTTLKTLSFGIHDFEDLTSCGRIGLVMAAKEFDPDKGFEFSTLAGRFIRNQLWNAVHKSDRGLAFPKKVHNLYRAWYALPVGIGLEEAAERLHVARATLARVLAAKSIRNITLDKARNAMMPQGLSKEDRMDLKAALAILDDRERFIISALYCSGKNETDTGKALGVGQSQVNRLKNRAIRKMREAMGIKAAEAV